MAIRPIENSNIPLFNNVVEIPISKIALVALAILGAIGFLAGGMYLAGSAGLAVAVLIAVFFGKKEAEPEIVHTDPVTQVMEQFHNPNIAGAIVGVYISSNETNLEHSVQVLESKPTIPNSCHIGFSGWHNFDIMALRKTDYGLICDFNPHNKKFIERTLAVLRNCSTREEFVEKMAAAMQGIVICPKTNPALATAASEIRGELEREGSWLFTDEGFFHIKHLADTDRITAIAEDICNTEVFKNISEEYVLRGIKVDTLYLSNISLFMKGPAKKDAFAKTIHALIEPETCVIHCPLKERVQDGVRIERRILDQEALFGRDLVDDSQLFNHPL